jgi:NADH dehydrogenase
MRARIYQPARTAMSSGTAKTKHWVLEFPQTSAREVDPLMGWTSSSDMQTQVQMTFDTKEAALEYAPTKGSTSLFKTQRSAAPMCGPAAMVKTLPQTVVVPGRTNAAHLNKTTRLNCVRSGHN